MLLLLGSATLLAAGPAGPQGAAAAAQEPPPGTAPAVPPEASEDIPEPPRFLSDLSHSIGDVAGDIFYWGQSGTVTGRILHNAFLGAQAISLDQGTIGGDLFVFAATTQIDGEVEGDLYAFTSDLRIGRDAVVHGNVMAYAGTVRIEGTVFGHLLGAGGRTVISGDVGPVNIESGNLTVTATGRVRGDLQYESNNEAEVADGARIAGTVRWNRKKDKGDEEEEEDDDAGGISMWRVLWKLWGYAGNLLVGVVLLLVGGRVTRQPSLSLDERPASGLGFGFVVTVVSPVACLVAMVLLVSLPLGVLGLVVFGIMLFLSRLVSALFLGTWILRRATGRVRPSEYGALALGLALLTLVAMIPYLGFLIRLAAVILGIGGIYLALRELGFPATATGAPPPAPAGEVR